MCNFRWILSLVLLSTIAIGLTGARIVPFKENIDVVFRQWSCNEPKPRLLYLENGYDDYNPSSIYLPHAVVINRCGKSLGCCKPGSICSPVEEENQEFVIDEFLHGKKTKKHVTLQNHLRCECVSSAPIR